MFQDFIYNKMIVEKANRVIFSNEIIIPGQKVLDGFSHQYTLEEWKTMPSLDNAEKHRYLSCYKDNNPNDIIILVDTH